MALRSTYNTGVYDSGLYGVQETTQGAASAAVAVTSSADAVRVLDASASASAALSASQPSGVIIKDASVSASLNGIVSVSGVTYDVVDGFRTGYGVSTYGAFIYGENRSIEEASASATATFTSSLTVQITRNVSATADVTTSASASAVYSVVGSASAQASFAVDVAYNRIKAFSATEPVGFAVIAVSRYKWIEAEEPENTWTVAAGPSTTWVDADYLERAA